MSARAASSIALVLAAARGRDAHASAVARVGREADARRLEALRRVVHPRRDRRAARARAKAWTREHEQGLGGTAVVFRAIEDGSIDVYPEYTGTLAEADV